MNIALLKLRRSYNILRVIMNKSSHALKPNWLVCYRGNNYLLPEMIVNSAFHTHGVVKMSMVANINNKDVGVLTFCLLYMCYFSTYMMHWTVWWMCVNDYYLLFIGVKAQTEGKYDQRYSAADEIICTCTLQLL